MASKAGMFVAVLFEEEEEEVGIERRGICEATQICNSGGLYGRLLVAAAAAASVSAATSSHTVDAEGRRQGRAAEARQDQNALQMVAATRFANSPSHKTPPFTDSTADATRTSTSTVVTTSASRARRGMAPTRRASGSAASGVRRRRHSLPIMTGGALAAKPGLNAFNQDSVAGYRTRLRTRLWPRATASCSRP